MKTRMLISLLVIYFTFQSVPSSWALELVSPPQNSKVHPGETITIKVAPSSGERVGSVFFRGFGAEVKAPPYEYQYKVGPRDIGDIKIIIFAIKPESDGPFVSADAQFSSRIELVLKSSLPPTVTLQGIKVEQRKLFLTKVPEGTKGADLYETEQLRVYGTYSDGVERDVSSSATGTTYTSSDEKIAIADANGDVTAIGVGSAKITIKNGDKQVVVDVVVKHKR